MLISTLADDSLPWVWLGVALCTLGGFGYGFVRWARSQFRDAAVHDVEPVIKAAIAEAIQPIRAEQQAVARDLRAHMNSEDRLRAELLGLLDAGKTEDRAAFDEIREWRAGVDLALRNIQQAQVPHDGGHDG